MKSRLATLALLLVLATCTTAPSTPRGIFDIEGARAALRPGSDAEARRISADAEFLREHYGFDPAGSLRAVRAFRDLLDVPARMAALRAEPCLSFGRALTVATGFALVPEDADLLIRAAGGAPGAALADPAVSALLAALRADGLLNEDAGADFLRLDDDEAAALAALAARPGVAATIRARAGTAFVFHPADAAEWEKPFPHPAEDLGWLVDAVGIRLRAAYLPEVGDIVRNRNAADSLLAAARAAGIRFTGAGAILSLSRVLTEDPGPLDPAARERLAELAKKTWDPGPAAFRFLVRLARAPGSPELVSDLHRRWRYRFRPGDAPDLLRLLAAGVPEISLPDWIVTDRAPLTHPGDLLSPDPASAFADPNDLAFLRALSRFRPDLVAASRTGLEREVRQHLRGRRLRPRPGAPYDERADDLSRFLRPDLLKAILLLEALERPAWLARLFEVLDLDLARPDSEVGGWVVLGPDGRFELVVYDGPGGDGNDRLRLPVRPEAAIEFHFHATDRDDSAYSGPSSGRPGTDLFRAAHDRLDGLVLTKLRGETLGCDLYTSAKNVLDLGVRTRPETMRSR